MWVISRKASTIEVTLFGKMDLNSLSSDSQSLREWVCQKGEKKWSIDACLYTYHLYLSGFFVCTFFLFSLFFLFFLSTSPSFRSSPLFTIHSYPFLYHLPWWDLPFLLLNYFWLLISVLPGLSIGLSTAQPLSLLRVCWLHHSLFPNKIACLVSYLSLFSLHSSG